MYYEYRLWPKIKKTNKCWIWLASCTTFGYGQFWVKEKPSTPAHRIVYELLRGKVPDGYELDHLCRNPKCVNPDHLEPVTHRTNVLRGKCPTAKNAIKTVCKRGHDLGKIENLYTGTWVVGKQRHCRLCHRINSKRRYIKRTKLKS